MRIALLAALLSAASISIAQSGSQDPFELSCLEPQQLREFVALSKKLQQDFRLAELIEARKRAMAAKDAIAIEAAECDRRRKDGLLGSLAAEMDGCMSKLREYNQLHRHEATTTEQLLTNQRLVFNQLQIERSTYPRCR